MDCDFLVIGSGIAGLTFALEASKYGNVTIISKKNLSEANTRYAQGGIASVWDEKDSYKSHIEDTIRVGRGISHSDIVNQIISSGKTAIKFLIENKIEFTKLNDGTYDLGMEGGHSYRRILYKGDYTGAEIEEKLIAAVRAKENIEIKEEVIAIDLITEHQLPNSEFDTDNITCYGAYLKNLREKVIFPVHAKKTILATGGVGGVYEHTTNSEIATGDGIAMAYRAGANIANMEFVQFHPTTFYNKYLNSSFLISEAVRGEGAILLNSKNERFMEKYDQRLELAPRDVVARAIDHEMKSSGEKCVYLDISHKAEEKLKERFPKIYKTCLQYGCNIAKEPIPVVPAAHYLCGGICADLSGQTNIHNLFAIGETAHTGLHGANRLASNSLLEGTIMGIEAAKKAAEDLEKIEYRELSKWHEEGVFDEKEWVIVSHNRETIKNLMWEYVGIVRSNRRLDKAYKRLSMIKEEIDEFYTRNPINADLLETRNIATVAKTHRIFCTSAKGKSWSSL